MDAPASPLVQQPERPKGKIMNRQPIIFATIVCVVAAGAAGTAIFNVNPFLQQSTTQVAETQNQITPTQTTQQPTVVAPPPSNTQTPPSQLPSQRQQQVQVPTQTVPVPDQRQTVQIPPLNQTPPNTTQPNQPQQRQVTTPPNTNQPPVTIQPQQPNQRPVTIQPQQPNQRQTVQVPRQPQQPNQPPVTNPQQRQLQPPNTGPIPNQPNQTVPPQQRQITQPQQPNQPPATDETTPPPNTQQPVPPQRTTTRVPPNINPNQSQNGGLGIDIRVDQSGNLVVNGTIPRSPGQIANLQPGDQITHIDGEAIAGLRREQVIQRLRGAPGSQVVLTIVRRGAEPREVPLTRAPISQILQQRS
jgi:hypothetical protein